MALSDIKKKICFEIKPELGVFFRFKSAVVVHLRRNLITTAVTSAVIHAYRINQMMSVSTYYQQRPCLALHPHSSESHHSNKFFSFRQICCHNSYFLCPMKFRDNNLVRNKLQSTKFKKKRVTAPLHENLEYSRIWPRKKEPITFLISILLSAIWDLLDLVNFWNSSRCMFLNGCR